MLTHNTNDADRVQSLRALTELAALDEAHALKFVFGQLDAGAMTEDEVTQLCGEVDKFAARKGIDLTRGLSKFWLVETRDPVAGLSGAVVVGDDVDDAVKAARALGVHPGSAARARQIPRRQVPDETWRERLLSAAELRELSDVANPRYDA